MCKRSGETVNHLQLYCEIARVLWDDVLNILELAWVMPAMVVVLLASWTNLEVFHNSQPCGRWFAFVFYSVYGKSEMTGCSKTRSAH